MLKRMLKWTCSLMVLLPLLAVAETQYISDELAVPLRRGPTNGHKIIHAGLPSGTPLEILAKDDGSGFVQVRTPNGLEGFVPAQFLTSTPIARDRLVAATKKVETLTAELTNLRQSLKTEQGARGSAEGAASDLGKQVKELQADLAEIRRVSADSVAMYEENKSLKAQNEALTVTTNEQAREISALKSNSMQTWLLLGGGLVAVGLALGVAIKSRPKARSGW